MTDWLPGGIVKRVVRIYPAEAKARGVLGRVDVKTLINSDGDVIQACGRGPKLLIPAAEKAALEWKFRTPTLTTDKGLIKCRTSRRFYCLSLLWSNRAREPSNLSR
jgi:hypothetical protein